MENDKEKMNFDDALARLEHIVAKIQDGDIRLSELRPAVEEAAAYVKICREELEGIKAGLPEDLLK